MLPGRASLPTQWRRSRGNALVRGLIQDSPSCPVCGCALPGTPALSGVDRGHKVPGTYEIAICSRCGVGVTLPRLRDDQLRQFYPPSYPHETPSGAFAKLAAAAWLKVEAQLAFNSFPLAAVNEIDAGKALDVGCGQGNLGAQLVDRGWRVVGVDPSPAACSAARKRGLDARVGTFLDVPVEEGEYSLVVFRHSLEHVADPVMNLQAAASALCEAGLLVVTVPNFECWQRRLFRSYWLHLDLPRHRLHFTSASLRHAVERCGFSVIGMRLASSAPTVAMTVLQLAFGRQPFPTGLGLRLTIAACCAFYPLARVVDIAAGGGDVIHLLARR